MEILLTGLVTHIVTAAWEHWLGKTKKITANSTAEIVSSAIVKTCFGGTGRGDGTR